MGIVVLSRNVNAVSAEDEGFLPPCVHLELSYGAKCSYRLGSLCSRSPLELNSKNGQRPVASLNGEHILHVSVC